MDFLFDVTSNGRPFKVLAMCDEVTRESIGGRLALPDRHSNFHVYERIQPTADVGALLDEIDQDHTSIFWGDRSSAIAGESTQLIEDPARTLPERVSGDLPCRHGSPEVHRRAPSR
jgi:hypothetical protein